MRRAPVSIDSLPIRSFNAGDILVQEGSDAKCLYFLARGTVEVSKEGQSITRVRERGAMFGEMSVLLESKPTATVTAIDQVECRVASNPEEFLAANPDVVLYICWILARRLDSLNRYLVDVRLQYADRGDHLGMVNEVLGAIMNRQPRDVAPQTDPGH
jgi:CRP/FNR family cyclic AMP-dependent transcriptional regulator